MKYGEKITFRWNPQLKRLIILGIISIFIVGAVIGSVIGIFIGKASAAAKSEAPEEEPIESEIVTEIHEAPTSSTPTKTYYDCPLSEELQDYIRKLCEENKLPMHLIISLINVESSFRSDIISGTNDYGLMQINKINHEWLSEKYGITDFLDPYQNVLCGISILSENYSRFGDLDKALMAYNLGATGAKRLWDKGIYSTSYTQKIRNKMEEYEV